MVNINTHVPTNAELRDRAIKSIPPNYIPGQRNDYLQKILEEFLKLQYFYFPLFCWDTMRVNYQRSKELETYGHKSPTRMVGGKVYEGTTGWSQDRSLKESWIIPEQLHTFMLHVSPDFWMDINAPVRNGFMKGILGGEDPYTLLRKVYAAYGSNLQKPVKEVTLDKVGVQE